MILKEWLPGQSLREINLWHSAFWVQIHGLPLEMTTQENAESIGKVMGNLLEIDPIFETNVSVKRFLRIRVEIDTTNPSLMDSL